MLATVRDRLTAAILVLIGGAEALSSDYSIAVAMMALAVVDCVARCRATRHGAVAVARAAELPAGTRPASDPTLLEALRRAGVPARRVAAAIESGACSDCVRLPILEREPPN